MHGTVSKIELSAEALRGRSFRFGVIDGSHIGLVKLADSGMIAGYQHPNEQFWSVADGQLVFSDFERKPTTVFDRVPRDDDRLEFLGGFVLKGSEPFHTLVEIEDPQSVRVLAELRRELYGDDSPVAYADLRWRDDGFMATHILANVISAVLDVVRPRFWLELGSMVGGSAIRVAQVAKLKNSNTDVICVDPFTGDVNMWAWEQPRRKSGEWLFLRLDHGRPTIYDRFIANVVAAGHDDVILPIAATSIVGVKLMRRLYEEKRISCLPDVIYVDSAHEPDETFLELANSWELLEPGGVLMGDDWDWASVRNDVIRFAKTVRVNRKQNQRLMAQNDGFVDHEGVLLDRTQWVIAK